MWCSVGICSPRVLQAFVARRPQLKCTYRQRPGIIYAQHKQSLSKGENDLDINDEFMVEQSQPVIKAEVQKMVIYFVIWPLLRYLLLHGLFCCFLNNLTFWLQPTDCFTDLKRTIMNIRPSYYVASVLVFCYLDIVPPKTPLEVTYLIQNLLGICEEFFYFLMLNRTGMGFYCSGLLPSWFQLSSTS